MSYQDRMSLLALELVNASRGGVHAGNAAYKAAWNATRGRNGIDPIHLAQLLADMVWKSWHEQALAVGATPLQEEEHLQMMLDELRLLTAAEIPNPQSPFANGRADDPRN